MKIHEFFVFSHLLSIFFFWKNNNFPPPTFFTVSWNNENYEFMLSFIVWCRCTGLDKHWGVMVYIKSAPPCTPASEHNCEHKNPRILCFLTPFGKNRVHETYEYNIPFHPPSPRFPWMQQHNDSMNNTILGKHNPMV